MTDLLAEPFSNMASTRLFGTANDLLAGLSRTRNSTSLLLAAESARSDDGWFWSEAWQAGERRVDALVARGETRIFGDADEFLAFLDDFPSM